MAVNIRNIPNYIRARSPQRLRVLMLRNNLRKARKFEYSISFAQGAWWAWYVETATVEENNGSEVEAQAR